MRGGGIIIFEISLWEMKKIQIIPFYTARKTMKDQLYFLFTTKMNVTRPLQVVPCCQVQPGGQSFPVSKEHTHTHTHVFLNMVLTGRTDGLKQALSLWQISCFFKTRKNFPYWKVLTLEDLLSSSGHGSHWAYFKQTGNFASMEGDWYLQDLSQRFPSDQPN